MKLRTNLPRRLNKEPLLEAIWQFRFLTDQAVASEILIGNIFRKLQADIQSVDRLLFGLPKEMTERQPNLMYAPSIRLDGPQFSFGVGQRIVSLSAKLPYCGWDIFGKKILELAQVIEDAKVVSKIENFSMKYIDCLSEPVETSINTLTIDLAIAGRDFKAEPILLRTEFTELGLKHSVQVALPAHVTLAGSGQTRNGIITEVETFCSPRSESGDLHDWMKSQLDEVHNANKSIFFALLTDETLALLEPVYDKEVH